MRVRQNKYTNDFKAEAVAMIRRDDRSYRQLAADLGVNAWTLRGLVQQRRDAEKAQGRQSARHPEGGPRR